MGDGMNLFQRLIKKLGEQNKQTLWIILIIGAVLLLAAGWSGGKKEKTEPASASLSDGQQYLEQLEARLEKTLQQVEGAGKVTVMLTPKSRGKISVAQDTKSNVSETGKTQESAIVLSGGDDPVVLEEYYPTVGGAVIIAQGAWSPEVKETLKRAAGAVLQIGINRIEVLEGSGKH